MERLKLINVQKSTLPGSEFHTFTKISHAFGQKYCCLV